ncbi:hypothetical protein [Devosia sp.]|uniref:hypothetical protein n=1 Tax=Devosia sp. TaxID=1871048 RepID=UPI001B2F27A8|nr:hypothetical protein [Devosia sp.]MBO9589051.1 hypothetical protein [Devosia sp.]
MKLPKQFAGLAVLALVTLVIWPIAVFAQEGAGVVAAEPTFLQQLLVAVLPALGLAITAVLTWAANELHKRTGIDIEARHREALQSALLNGVKFALQKAGWLPNTPLPANLLGFASSYVSSSVPDALKHFNIDPSVPQGIAVLERLITPHLPLPLGTVLPNGDMLVGQVQ